ncbi:MAG TPA: LCP family protein [Mycobacteriales bacterium]|nr:LCP family protein [Mycobacteriales bacterium]
MLRWTALGLAVVVVLAGGTVFFVARHIEGGITVARPVPAGPPPPKPVANAENFLLIGSDSRSGSNGKGTGGSDVPGQRSDTTLILHISAGGKHATLVSIPRDSYVQIPACNLPHGKHSKPFMSKFNAAFSEGGASCTITAIQHLTDIRIDHYAVVNFVGFEHIVEALGGVRMCVAQPLSDPKRIDPATGTPIGSGLKLPAGKDVEINGGQALDLMRARYGIGNGSDISRIKRQQQFIGAMIRKVTSGSLLLNPVKLTKVLSAVAHSLTTDGFGFSTMQQLASALHNVGSGGVQLLTVPLNPSPSSGVPSADVQWDPTKAPQLWQAILHDRPIPATATSGGASHKPIHAKTASKEGCLK